jgi:hypothetical protein
MIVTSYVQITSTDDVELWKLAAHLLAYYRAEPIEAKPRDFVTIHSQADRLRVTAPHRVSALTINACLDTSGQAESAGTKDGRFIPQGSPYRWLWSEALPLLLPAYLVDRLNAEYKLRDASRQKAARAVTRSVQQERMFE